MITAVQVVISVFGTSATDLTRWYRRRRSRDSGRVPRDADDRRPGTSSCAYRGRRSRITDHALLILPGGPRPGLRPLPRRPEPGTTSDPRRTSERATGPC